MTMTSSSARVLTMAELSLRAHELSKRSDDDLLPAGEMECLVTLQLADEWFAFEVSAVQEVLIRPLVSPVPLTPRFMSGLCNLRGEIIWVLDVREMLELPRSSSSRADGPAYGIVVRRGDVEVAIVTESVTEVAWVEKSSRQAPLATIPGRRAAFLEGSYRIGGQLVSKLALGKIIDHATLNQMQETAP